MESVTYPLTDEDKADILIKCAECFLVIDESVDAESFVNRASVLINNVPAATAVNLRFRTLFARVLDANRKFLDAALRYYELSTTNILQAICVLVIRDFCVSSFVYLYQVAREDLFVLLSKAIVCAILGKGCVQRDRIIGLLSKVLFYPVFAFKPCFLKFQTAFLGFALGRIATNTGASNTSEHSLEN